MKSISDHCVTARPERPYWLYGAVAAWLLLTIEAFHVGISRAHAFDQDGKDAEAQITGESVETYLLPIARDFSFRAYFVSYVFRTDDGQVYQASTEVDRNFPHYWGVGYKPPIRYHPDDPSHNCLMIPSQTEYHDINPVGIFAIGVLQAILGAVCLVVYFGKYSRGSFLDRRRKAPLEA
ncbi:MAG TPA: DUF3592 domain-containing protein [Candidatus Methylacidiphilales bacterium]|jgi:hypothetical protein|nr:DUF3592 domain-containing protein [Candidatus Methylacidiphilales bacterium]